MLMSDTLQLTFTR